MTWLGLRGNRRKWHPRLSSIASGVVCTSFVGVYFAIRVNAAEAVPCRSETFEGNSFTVCEVDLRQDTVRLFWKERDGRPYNFLQALPQRVDEDSGPLLFATNAGMFTLATNPLVFTWRTGKSLCTLLRDPGPAISI